METIEYKTKDKSEWGHGEWQDEPDKVQWRDKATGLPCLIVRNHSGAWCGYVGLDETHPLHGKGYNDVSVDVHGGLTFAGFCRSHTADDYQKSLQRMEVSREEAKKYPVGAAARRLKEWSPVMNDFDAWKKQCEATYICHIPAPGEPERVWWLGFDCSHLDDVSPAYDHKYEFDSESWYKDIGYVRSEVTKLAAQLKAHCI